jgi:uncharacterized membrane protein YgaE (UPF0421/DUF939 family)
VNRQTTAIVAAVAALGMLLAATVVLSINNHGAEIGLLIGLGSAAMTNLFVLARQDDAKVAASDAAVAATGAKVVADETKVVADEANAKLDQLTNGALDARMERAAEKVMARAMVQIPEMVEVAVRAALGQAGIKPPPPPHGPTPDD